MVAAACGTSPDSRPLNSVPRETPRSPMAAFQGPSSSAKWPCGHDWCGPSRAVQPVTCAQTGHSGVHAGASVPADPRFPSPWKHKRHEQFAATGFIPGFPTCQPEGAGAHHTTSSVLSAKHCAMWPSMSSWASLRGDGHVWGGDAWPGPLRALTTAGPAEGEES